MGDVVREYRYSTPVGAPPELARGGLASLTRALAEGLQSPAMATLGMRLAAVEDGACEVRCPAEAFMSNHFGIVHGATAAALLDTAMSGAAHTVIDEESRYTTIDLSVRYLRPVSAGSGELVCRGRVLQARRRLIFTEGHVEDASGRVVAHGTAALLVVPAPEE